MPPGGMPPQGQMPPGAPPQQPPQPPPQLAASRMMPPGAPQGGMPPGLAQLAGAGGQGGRPNLSPQEMAHLGRGGDTLVAHLTPGEIEVPPQVQTPKLLADLREAFGKVGASPQQFTAGSPQSSVNPQSGIPEYNIWSAILPAALGLGGAFLAPELLPAAMAGYGGLAAAGGAALGSGIGTAATGGNLGQSALSALGAGAGTYIGGGGLNGLMGGGEAAKTAASNAAGAAGSAGGAAGAGSSAPLGGGSIYSEAAGPPMQNSPGLNPLGSGFLGGTPLTKGQLTGLGLGSVGASLLGPSLLSQSGTAATPNPALPAGFKDHMPAVNPNYQQLLGNNGAAVRPQFAGYNPYAAVTGSPYNFFPQS
jgi:hypothetical protein